MTVSLPCLSVTAICTRTMVWSKGSDGWQAECGCGYSSRAASGYAATLDRLASEQAAVTS